MGKILDTITVLFKGDTSDLKRKKKEAEDLASETAKNIKDIHASTSDTNSALETTNKSLVQTENLTEGIGAGIASWVIAAHQASESINDAIGARKAYQEQERVRKGLAATARGAAAVESTLKGVVKQFAAAAFGALTIGEAVSRFKDVVSGTLDLQRESFSLNVKPSEIDAVGQAAKKAGGDIEDVYQALHAMSDKYGGITGPVIQDYLIKELKAIHEAKSDFAAQVIGKQFNIPENLIRAARRPEFFKDIENIKKIDSGIDEATQKTKLLSDAWNEFSIHVRGTFIDFENLILGPLTKIIKTFDEIYTDPRISTFGQGTYGNENFSFSFLHPKASAPVSNFPLTKGANSVANTTTVRINNVIVEPPKDSDPSNFAQAFVGELGKHISDLLHYHDNSIVG